MPLVSAPHCIDPHCRDRDRATAGPCFAFVGRYLITSKLFWNCRSSRTRTITSARTDFAIDAYFGHSPIPSFADGPCATLRPALAAIHNRAILANLPCYNAPIIHACANSTSSALALRYTDSFSIRLPLSRLLSLYALRLTSCSFVIAAPSIPITPAFGLNTHPNVPVTVNRL